MEVSPKLTTKAACRVARIDRARFNEHVSDGFYTCAPETVSGRTRRFDPHDMIALWLFREMMDDGIKAERAGHIACLVAEAARANPASPAISYVQSYLSPLHGSAHPADKVPEAAEWDTTRFSGTDIRKVTTFRIRKLREMIAHETEVERQNIGED